MSAEPENSGRERLIMLSDGVFAIAVTLLALDLRLPEEAMRSGHIFAALADNWERGLSFAISFWVIAIFWRANVRSFQWIERVDAPFVMLTLLLLMAVSFLPFPTSVLGQTMRGAEATIFYLVSLAVASAIQLASWVYAMRIGRLLRPDTPRDVTSAIVWRGIIPLGTFVVAIALAAAGAGGNSFYVLFAIPVVPRLMRMAGRA
ncbi:MAG TPA: TMEM175 family protein [Hyphomicrobiales bacterium]|nr:TMEM175 family protein [Hyphomicrobiales bacterium]